MRSALTNAFNIKINNFEGPFDLLFHLIEKNEIDIYDIPIHLVTDQYMDYLFAMKKLDLEIASEFLVMASVLLHIKSKMLLPEKKVEENDEIDPREELVTKLINYKRFKDFGIYLKKRKKKWEGMFYKLPEIYDFEKSGSISNLSGDELKKVYLSVIRRNINKINQNSEKSMTQILRKEKISVKSKIDEIKRLLVNKISFRFSKVFSLVKRSRTEVITAFLAVLELARNSKVWIKQENTRYSEILVYRKSSSKK